MKVAISRATGAALCLLAGCMQLASVPRTRTPKALLVMLDGCRGDVLDAARTPAIDSLRNGTWAEGYNGAWTLTGLNVPDADPSSAANHTAISTAADAAKTKVYRNGQTKDGAYAEWPTWLTRVTRAVPGTKALFAFSWDEGKQYPQTGNVSFLFGTDEANATNVARILASPDAPDAIQYFIDLPDHCGHAGGFYPYSPEYLRAVHVADGYLGRALAAIRSRPTFADEDWLVLVTGDHGGYLHSHGLWGGHCTTVPLVMAGRRTPAGRLPGAPRHYDLTATALAHFGLDPAALGLDGRPLTVAAAPATPRALRDGLAASFDFTRKDSVNAAGGAVAAKALGPRAFRLEGSEKLAFEHGGDFTALLWARLPATQQGDPVLFSNKDWRGGVNPGVALVAAKSMPGSRSPGVVFNAGRPQNGRIDVGQFDVEPDRWTFYAVVRNAEGVCVVYQGRSDGRLNWCCERAADIRVTSGLPFCVGQDGTGSYRHALTGDVGDFALWTRALSHEEIKSVYEAGREGLFLRDLL